MKETKTMWTRQVPEVWEELKTKGTYRVKEEYIRRKNDTIADYYLELIEETKAKLEKAVMEEKLKQEVIDVTLPAKKNKVGHRHPNTINCETM